MNEIELKEISFTYGKREPTLSSLSLSVGKGKILALIGRSGSGKSTILKLLGGFCHPQKGEIFLKGECVCDEKFSLPPEKRGLGILFQDYALFPHLNLAKNVGFGLNRLKRRERAREVDELFELINLVGEQKKYPHQISGGQQQRVALARALAIKANIFLLDEPFSSLDTATMDELKGELKGIFRSLNATVILVCHSYEHALDFADEIALLEGGEIRERLACRNVTRDLFDQRLIKEEMKEG